MSNVQVKLRRHLSLGQFDETWEIGIDKKGCLALRTGHDEIDEEYTPWQTEVEALKRILGFVPKSESLIKELRKEIGQLDTIPPYDGWHSVLNWHEF